MSNNIITVDIIIKYVPDCGDSVLLASEDKLLSILLLPARLGRLASVPAGLVVNMLARCQRISKNTYQCINIILFILYDISILIYVSTYQYYQ